MDGEVNDTQEEQAAEEQAQQEQQEAQAQVGADAGSALDYEKAIAERDGKIAELEAQIAEAAKTAEAAEGLKAQIEELKQQSADERVDFALQLAGVRNVKAARAVLADYDGDMEAMKEAEPWLFGKHAASEGVGGTTGLPNAGAATDANKQMKHWREVAGLEDGNDE